MRVVVLICALSGFFFPGCKKEPAWKTQTYTEQTVKPQVEEVKIPESLWVKIAALNTPEKSSPKKEEHEASSPETVLEPIKVYLAERNKGVLKGQNVALSFAAGGGELNLSDFVAPRRGSYYVAFDFMPAVEAAETKVFFLSNSVLRKVGRDELGSGCNTYFDLTKRFAVAMKHEGFLVNTSDQRDVSALAGTYVFVKILEGKLHMATLVIKDEEHRALQCRH